MKQTEGATFQRTLDEEFKVDTQFPLRVVLTTIAVPARAISVERRNARSGYLSAGGRVGVQVVSDNHRVSTLKQKY